MKTNEIVYDRDKITHAIHDINEIVVSLDRIGSSANMMSKSESCEVLDRFLVEWRVFHKLAELRLVLSEQFSSEVGEDGMDELERLMQGARYWSYDHDFLAKKNDR